MGKISYRPKKSHHKEHKRVEVEQAMRNLENELIKEENSSEDIVAATEDVTRVITISNHKNNRGKLDNLKVVGDMECDYHIFVEDYVYTYLYQYAASDLSKESSAALIGEVYGESKEIVIRGIIPIRSELLSADNEWIDRNVLEDIEKQRKQYFKDQDIIGWMHMQPGYGTMLTMKELREHKDVFEGNGSLCMLVDAINKIETLFVYEDEELKEQSGYCMYYERNEQMQQYMLDHPFASYAKEEMKDNVVNQFREIGKIRKAEYMQRKSLNVTVMAISIILIALTAVIVKMNDSKNMNQTIPVTNTSPDYMGVNEEISDKKNVLVTPAQPTDSSADLQDHLTSNQGQTNEALAKPEETTEAINTENTKINNEQAQDGEYEIYVVQPGDTLADISYKKFGEAKRSVEIAKLNGIEDTNQIYVGQELKIPENK